MLVSPPPEQVTRRRRKYSKGESSPESTSASLTMFTRAQATAANTPASGPNKTSVAVSDTTHVSSQHQQSLSTVVTKITNTTAAVTSGGNTGFSSVSAIDGGLAPNVSLTITAVAAANVPQGIPINTTSVPALDTPTITNLVLNSLEGVHSGVPTRTTPTLTPTTLRNIEQTFLELSSLPPPENHTNQAGFVPPLVQPNGGSSTYVSVDSKCWGGGTLTQISAPITATTCSSSSSSNSSSSSSSTATSIGGLLQLRAPSITTTSSSIISSNNHLSTSSGGIVMPSQIQHSAPRRMGGRRPMKDEKKSMMTPDWFNSLGGPCELSVEEEEKRSQRRERNKLAAARCRKRRLDQTNMLQDETDDLEDKKSDLQQEIQLLQQQRDELEFLLATHKAVCRRRFQNSSSSVATTGASSITHTSSSTTGIPSMTTTIPTTITSNISTASAMLHSHHHHLEKKAMLMKVEQDIIVKEEPMDNDDGMVITVTKPPTDMASRPRRPTSLAVAPVALRTPSVADLGVPIETPSAGLRGLNFESMMEGGTGLTPVTSGSAGLMPIHTGLTPLTTPVVSAPAPSSVNCGSQQRSSSSDLSSPDSVPPKLVSL